MIDNMCHRKRNDYKIDMAIDTFWHESIVHKIGKVLFKCSFIYTDFYEDHRYGRWLEYVQQRFSKIPLLSAIPK